MSCRDYDVVPSSQNLKRSELEPTASSESDATTPKRAMNPRALVLAPTHELSRQLSGFAKALLHNIKLRVLCTSQANVPSSGAVVRRNVSAAEMAATFDDADSSAEGAEFVVSGKSTVNREVDVLVGTPTKVLEMVRGRGWDWERRVKEREEKEKERGGVPEERSQRQWTIGEPETGLANVEWVIIDEADVLLGTWANSHAYMPVLTVSYRS